MSENKKDSKKIATADIFRDWLNSWIKIKSLTQLEAAKIFDLTPGYISHIINGRRSASMATMGKIASKTGITLNNILNATDYLKFEDFLDSNKEKKIKPKVKPTPKSNKTQPIIDKSEALSNKTEPVIDKSEALSNKTEPVIDKAEALSNKTEPVIDKAEALSNKTEPVIDKLKVLSNKTEQKVTNINEIKKMPAVAMKELKSKTIQKIDKKDLPFHGHDKELVIIPLYGTINNELYHNEESFIYVIPEEAKDQAFAVAVADNSMFPKISKNDIVVTSPKKLIEKGDIVLIVIPPEKETSGQLLCRKCYLSPNGTVIFTAENNQNNEYPPLYLDPHQQGSKTISIYKIVKVIKEI